MSRRFSIILRSRFVQCVLACLCLRVARQGPWNTWVNKAYNAVWRRNLWVETYGGYVDAVGANTSEGAAFRDPDRCPCQARVGAAHRLRLVSSVEPVHPQH